MHGNRAQNGDLRCRLGVSYFPIGSVGQAPLAKRRTSGSRVRILWWKFIWLATSWARTNSSESLKTKPEATAKFRTLCVSATTESLESPRVPSFRNQGLNTDSSADKGRWSAMQKSAGPQGSLLHTILGLDHLIFPKMHAWVTVSLVDH